MSSSREVLLAAHAHARAAAKLADQLTDYVCKVDEARGESKQLRHESTQIVPAISMQGWVDDIKAPESGNDDVLSTPPGVSMVVPTPLVGSSSRKLSTNSCLRPFGHIASSASGVSSFVTPVHSDKTSINSRYSKSESFFATLNKVKRSSSFASAHSSDIGHSLKNGFDPVRQTTTMRSSVLSTIASIDAAGTGCVSRFVKSHVFDALSALAISLNALYIGVHTDYMAGAHGDTLVSRVLDAFKIFFATIFAIELLLRIYAFRCSFFCSSASWAWNYFDIVVVLGSGLDVLLSQLDVGDQSSTVEVSSMRLLRIIRITRLIRVIRMARLLRFVRALRDLIFSIVGTMKSLMWSLVLLAMILYCFAIAFTQAVIDSERMLDDVSDLQYYFGSISTSMFTLFKTITNGISWHEVVTPLEDAG